MLILNFVSPWYGTETKASETRRVACANLPNFMATLVIGYIGRSPWKGCGTFRFFLRESEKKVSMVWERRICSDLVGKWRRARSSVSTVLLWARVECFLPQLASTIDIPESFLSSNSSTHLNMAIARASHRSSWVDFSSLATLSSFRIRNIKGLIFNGGSEDIMFRDCCSWESNWGRTLKSAEEWSGIREGKRILCVKVSSILWGDVLLSGVELMQERRSGVGTIWATHWVSAGGNTYLLQSLRSCMRSFVKNGETSRRGTRISDRCVYELGLELALESLWDGCQRLGIKLRPSPL